MAKNKLAEIIKKAIQKETGFKLKANINWNNIGKAVDCDGKSYQMKLEGNQVRLVGNGKNKLYPIDLAIPLLDVYDKQGNLISNSEDYD